MPSAPVARSHGGAMNRREGMVRRKSSRRRISSKSKSEDGKHHDHHHHAHDSESLFSTAIISESSSRQENGHSKALSPTEMNSTNNSSKSSRRNKYSQSQNQSTSRRNHNRSRKPKGEPTKSHSLRSLDNSMSTSKLSQEEEAWRGIHDVLNGDSESVATKDVLPEGIANALGHSTSGESAESNDDRLSNSQHLGAVNPNSSDDRNNEEEEDMDYDEAAKQMCGFQSNNPDSKDMPSLMNSSFSSLNSENTDMKSTISQLSGSHNRVVHKNTASVNGLDPLKQYLLGVTSSLQGRRQLNDEVNDDGPPPLYDNGDLEDSFSSHKSDATESKSILSYISRNNTGDMLMRNPDQPQDVPMHNFLVGITTALQKKQQDKGSGNADNPDSTAVYENEQQAILLKQQSGYPKTNSESHSAQSPSRDINVQKDWTAAAANSPPPSGRISMIKKKKSPRMRSKSNPGPEIISQSLSSLPMDNAREKSDALNSSMPSLSTFREDDVDDTQQTPSGITRNLLSPSKKLLGEDDEDAEELEEQVVENNRLKSKKSGEPEDLRPPKPTNSPTARSLPGSSDNMKAQKAQNQRGVSGRSPKERPKLSQSNSQRSPQIIPQSDSHRGAAGVGPGAAPPQQIRRSSTGESSHSGTAQQRRRSSTGGSSHSGTAQRRRRSSTGGSSHSGLAQQSRRSSTGSSSHSGTAQQRRRSSTGTTSSAGLSQQRRRSSTGTTSSAGLSQQRRRSSTGTTSSSGAVQSLRRGSNGGNPRPGQAQQHRRGPPKSSSPSHKTTRRTSKDSRGLKDGKSPTSTRPYHSDHIRKKKESTCKRASAPPGASSELMKGKTAATHSNSAFGDHFFEADFSNQEEAMTPAGAFDSFFPEEPILDHGTGRERKNSITGGSSPNRFKIKNPFRSSGSDSKKKALKGRDDSRFFESDEDDQMGALMYN